MIFAVLAIALGCLVSMLNWASLIQSAITKKLASPVPLIGALFLGLGLSYFEKARPYAILSIIADYPKLYRVRLGYATTLMYVGVTEFDASAFERFGY